MITFLFLINIDFPFFIHNYHCFWRVFWLINFDDIYVAFPKNVALPFIGQH